MKKFNAIAPVLVIMAVLIFGTTANAGTLVGDRTGLAGETPQTCTASTEKPDWGILIMDLVGILIMDFTGGSTASAPTNCGILIMD